jgi:hypothetical protein
MGSTLTLDLFDRAVATARRDGWVVGRFASVFQMKAAARGWQAIPNRSDSPPLDRLKPVRAQDARPGSMSASTGLGEQPLHVDGSHKWRPPEFVLLFSVNSNSCPTRVLPLRHRAPFLQDARHGMFMITGGRVPFLAPALNQDGWRWDPLCMEPCDRRARSVAEHFGNNVSAATAIPWDTPDQFILLNNRHVLHGRSKVPEHGTDRIIHRISYSKAQP